MNIKQLYQLFKKCSGISIDSRTLKRNEMFFPIKGPNFDGHHFVKEAIKRGASHVIIDDKSYQQDKTILVHNTIEVLQQLANHHRNEIGTVIVAIMGSNGKTTTKELTHAVLRPDLKCGFTKGNLNNYLGVPLTLLSFDSSHDVGIVEMGANHVGEIKLLAEIAEPDYGIITNIGKAHLQGFGGIDGVLKGKTELYKFLIRERSHIFCNIRDSLLIEQLGTYPNYSFYDPKELKVLPNNDLTLGFSLYGKEYKTQMAGMYNLPNIAVALEIARVFKVPEDLALKAITKYTPKNNRSQIVVKSGVKYLLDAYNANPNSMSLSIQNFKTLEGKPKILILGDMLELGKSYLEEHQKILQQSLEMEVDQIYTVGPKFKATNLKNPKLMNFNARHDLKTYLKKHPLVKDSLVLIKGSRGIKLEAILD